MTAMKSWDLVFTGPGQVEFRQEELPPPGPGEVQCRACLSLVSPAEMPELYLKLLDDPSLLTGILIDWSGLQ